MNKLQSLKSTDEKQFEYSMSENKHNAKFSQSALYLNDRQMRAENSIHVVAQYRKSNSQATAFAYFVFYEWIEEVSDDEGDLTKGRKWWHIQYISRDTYREIFEIFLSLQ